MSEWQDTTLGEVAKIQVGFAFPSARFDEEPSGPRLVRGVNISQGSLDWGRTAFWPHDDTDPRYDLALGDAVLAMDRPWIEAGLKRARMRWSDLPALLVQRVARLRGDTDALTSFLYHVTGSPEFVSYIRNVADGTTVPHISETQIRAFPMALPPADALEQIVGALDAIDDLIENNRRRVEVLEEMARAIYREWFVQFRFPGHEDATFVDSDLGPIPEGWEAATLGKAGQWLSGGTPRTSVEDYWNGDIPWITSGTLTSMLLDRSDRMVTQLGVENGTKVVPRDALIFVVRGMSLVREFRVGIADVPVAFGQDCKAVVVNEEFHPLFLAFEVISRAEEIQGMHELAGHGTGKLSTDRLKAILVPKPPMPLQEMFARELQPLRESMTALRLGTDHLIEMRDVLLPRLVTGKVDVSNLDLDAVVEKAAV